MSKEATVAEVVLCRLNDVNTAIHNSFQKLIESETKSLQELADSLREELSKMDLFVSQESSEETEDR